MCRLCGNTYVTITHKISKCSKLAQKEYEIKDDWARKVINWEL